MSNSPGLTRWWPLRATGRIHGGALAFLTAPLTAMRPLGRCPQPFTGHSCQLWPLHVPRPLRLAQSLFQNRAPPPSSFHRFPRSSSSSSQLPLLQIVPPVRLVRSCLSDRAPLLWAFSARGCMVRDSPRTPAFWVGHALTLKSRVHWPCTSGQLLLCHTRVVTAAEVCFECCPGRQQGLMWLTQVGSPLEETACLIHMPTLGLQQRLFQ
mmetsp:Transcript_13717/g.41446  ORF Transcript_13717/g.41446 Transcript_13717/m.41446 type:complete len:209 (-) Transcript_13717:2042-2668(-)